MSKRAGWVGTCRRQGCRGHRRPLCHSLPLFASQTQFPTPPGAGVRGGREEGESRTFLSVRRCRELGTASLGLPGVMGCLGSTFPLRAHRSWLRARASPSQLIACSFLSSWESGNREGKPSLVRPVVPPWPDAEMTLSVRECSHARSLSLTWPASEPHGASSPLPAGF